MFLYRQRSSITISKEICPTPLYSAFDLNILNDNSNIISSSSAAAAALAVMTKVTAWRIYNSEKNINDNLRAACYTYLIILIRRISPREDEQRK